MLLSSSNQGTLYGHDTWNARERRGMFAGFLWEKGRKEVVWKIKYR